MIDAQINTLTPSIMLQTPWFSQLQDNGEANGACAQACLLMLLHYYQAIPSNERVNLEDLCALKPDWLTAHDLVSLAAKPFKLSLMPFVAGNVLSLRQYLLSGRPVMLLVNYALLDFESHLPQGEDLRTHWLLLIGYQDNDFVLHDPLVAAFTTTWARRCLSQSPLQHLADGTGTSPTAECHLLAPLIAIGWHQLPP